MLLVPLVRNWALSKWWIVEARRAKGKSRRNTQRWALRSKPRSPVWRSQLGEDTHFTTILDLSCRALLSLLVTDEIAQRKDDCMYHPLGVHQLPELSFPDPSLSTSYVPPLPGEPSRSTVFTIWVPCFLPHPQQLSSKSFASSLSEATSESSS